MNPEQFAEAIQRDFGVALTDTQKAQFERYYEELVDWNTRMNLTAITDKEEVYLKHFYDSLTLCRYDGWQDAVSIADIGAGAGFPSLPLKILFPHLNVTIVDSLNKRITFLNHLVDVLGLEGVTAYHDRAETFGKGEHREMYDVVTARAVARLNVLAELCVPLVKKGGHFVALKASQGEKELAEAKRAFQMLGVEMKTAESFALPNGDERYLLVTEKVKATPKKYPRKPGTPNKQPL